MPDESKSFAEMVASASLHEIPTLLRDPRFAESEALLLLTRNELSMALLDEIGKRRELMKSARVSYAVASHAHVSHPLALRALRNLYVMDLVKLSLAPAAPPGIRAAAEDTLIARLPQIPLGQRISLARQASARVLGELLILGGARFVDIALESARMTEAAVLKVLAQEKIGERTLGAVLRHAKWKRLPNVRMAILQRADLPEGVVAKLVARCSAAELRVLEESTRLSDEVKRERLRRLAGEGQ